MGRIIRVFPRRTNATPTDAMAFVGDPPLWRPDADEVHVSCTFTWDMAEAERLARLWARYYPVRLGGPAYDDAGGDFQPGMYLKPGYTITSRGCPNRCDYCLVPEREGRIRLLPIQSGWDLLDNNLLACPRPHIEAVLDMMAGQSHPAKFTGGIYARDVTEWFAKRLAGMRMEVLYVAYDRPEDRASVERASRLFYDAFGWSAGQGRRKLGCYVLVGFKDDTDEQAIERLEFVKALGVTPFAMFYGGPERERSDKAKAMKRRLRKWTRPWSAWAATETADQRAEQRATEVMT